MVKTHSEKTEKFDATKLKKHKIIEMGRKSNYRSVKNGIRKGGSGGGDAFLKVGSLFSKKNCIFLFLFCLLSFFVICLVVG